MPKTKSPASSARYALRENVSVSAASMIAPKAASGSRHLGFWKAAPRVRRKVKARKAPTKFGSNQVESRRPTCGSQPSTSYSSKLGKYWSWMKPANASRVANAKIIQSVMARADFF